MATPRQTSSPVHQAETYTLAADQPPSLSVIGALAS
jgi:hypothetical protein